jgi:hypothetical protein
MAFFDYDGKRYSSQEDGCETWAEGLFSPALDEFAPWTFLWASLGQDQTTHESDAEIRIGLQGTVPETVPATYPVTPAGPGAFVVFIGGTRCHTEEGSIGITKYEGVGGDIEGTYSVRSFQGAGCPTALSGSFRAERRADGFSDPSCEPADSFSYDGRTFTEMTELDVGVFSICQPRVEAHLASSFGETMISFSVGRVAITLGAYGPAPIELPVEYPVPASARVGGFLGTTYLCAASGGSVIITRYDAVGGRIEGTYSGHSFEPLEAIGPCPSSASGAFSARRDGDW